MNQQTDPFSEPVDERLLQTLTPDGVLLDGLLQRARKFAEKTSTGTSTSTDVSTRQPDFSEKPVDLFLLIHGTGGNFYSSGALESFAGCALEQGYDVLRINTRGHDAVCHLSGPGKLRLGGAAYEDVSQCREDLRGWLDEVGRWGYKRVCLVGHSMGGVKAVYSQAWDRHPLVNCVVTISSPRFSHARMMHHPRMPAFREDWNRAHDLLSAGRGQELIHVAQPLPLLITAEGFIEKYGPDDRYDVVSLIPRVAVPMHAILGAETIKTSPAFTDLDADLRLVRAVQPLLTLSVVPEGDMHYRATPRRPFELTENWLMDVVAG